jgi:Cu/Ag efflux pump CusA
MRLKTSSCDFSKRNFGGAARESQVRVDPDKLIAYGMSILHPTNFEN